MKIMTILGTRPEVIRLNLIIRLLDRHTDQILVHTGQNYDPRLSSLFFEELGVRQPDVELGVRASGFAEQVGQILARSETLLLEHRPDRLLILGDTNSGLSALVARRLGIPVYHLEAGNRCFDHRVPEETNRRVIDHVSTVLMPYTERSRENLLREGFPPDRIYVVGNPIKEVMDHFADRIAASTALDDWGLEPERYFLVTMHRAENVDDPERLRLIIESLALLHRQYGFPVVCSLHPRTRARAREFKLDLDRAGLRFVEPFGFFDFVRLEQQAGCLLSDSGTVQEEACILGVPNVTLRDVTERPETIECGSGIIAGCRPESILPAVNLAISEDRSWRPPAEYLAGHVSETVCKIIRSLGKPREVYKSL